MRARDQIVAFLLTAFLLVLWLGFLFHRDERFAGSLWGGIFAVSGTILLLVPLIYSLIKRIPPLKRAMTKIISFSTLLSIHIYAGFAGAILALLHTGHKFHGLLASVLTGILLVLVFSGYIGRYLLGQIAKEISEKKQLLKALQFQYDSNSTDYKAGKVERKIMLSLTGAIADVEYAISTHELMKRLFSFWLKFHLVLSFVFYILLVFHIGGEYYFGLRWFS